MGYAQVLPQPQTEWWCYTYFELQHCSYGLVWISLIPMLSTRGGVCGGGEKKRAWYPLFVHAPNHLRATIIITKCLSPGWAIDVTTALARMRNSWSAFLWQWLLQSKPAGCAMEKFLLPPKFLSFFYDQAFQWEVEQGWPRIISVLLDVPVRHEQHLSSLSALSASPESNL